jgi:hypothetical protein
MFVVNGGTYAVTAPFWGWMCDKKIQPKLVTRYWLFILLTTPQIGLMKYDLFYSIGAGLVAVSFVFLGPLPFMPFQVEFNSTRVLTK